MIKPPPPNPYGEPAHLAHHYLAQAAEAATAAQDYLAGRRPAQETDHVLDNLLRLAEVNLAVSRLAHDMSEAAQEGPGVLSMPHGAK